MEMIAHMDRLGKAFGFSMAGLKAAWKSEAAFRQEVLLCAFLLPFGFWVAENGVELALLAGSLVLVLIVELLNSGLEAAIDRIGTDLHPLSKKAKDIGSSAVLLSLLNVLLVWGIVIFG